MFILQYSTGGELPKELRDPWNNLELLRNKGMIYLDSLKDTKKTKKDAKSDSDETV